MQNENQQPLGLGLGEGLGLVERLRRSGQLLHEVGATTFDDDQKTGGSLYRQAADEIERLRAALRLYVDAGFGNSTDHFKQGAAYDAAVEALGPNVGANRAAHESPR